VFFMKKFYFLKFQHMPSKSLYFSLKHQMEYHANKERILVRNFELKARVSETNDYRSFCRYSAVKIFSYRKL